MKEFLKYRNRIVLASAFLVVSTALVLLHFQLPGIAFGVMTGGFGSILKLWLSSLCIKKFGSGGVQGGPVMGARVRSAMTGAMFRYGLIAGILAVGFFISGINFIATAAAIFTTNIVIICFEIMRTLFPGGLAAIFGRCRSNTRAPSNQG